MPARPGALCVAMAPWLAARLRAYSLLLAGALGAGLVGALLDQLSLTLSPAYFTLGKGLDVPPAELRLAAAALGLRAGLPVGALVVGVALLRGVRTPAAWRRWLGRVALASASAALLGALLVPWLAPASYRALLTRSLGDADVPGYLRVLGLHAGAYLGALAGLVRASVGGRSPLGPTSVGPVLPL